MTQAFNQTFHTIVLQTTIKDLEILSIEGLQFSKTYKSIQIIQFDTIEAIENFMAYNLIAVDYIKILDKFFIFFNKDSKDTSEVISHFFDFISSVYDLVINTESNLINIKQLINAIIKGHKIGNDFLILDFGCGTGVSTIAKKEFDNRGINFRLLGFDTSSEMSKNAKKIGLDVINKKSLYNLKDCSLDGVFCSYVLHFVSDTEQFKMLWKKLKPGCILAANFHKNIGVSKFISLVESFKGEIEQLSFDISGSSFAFKKPLIPFVEIELIEKYVDNNHQVTVDTELIEALLNINIIPKYFFNSKSYVIDTDLRLLVPFLKSITSCCWKDLETNLYQKYFSINLIDTEICLISLKTITLDSSNISLLHKILITYNISDKLDKTFSFFIGSSIKVFTKNSKIKELVNEHKGLRNEIDQSKASIFTNSASYMGSKKSLRSFILESSTIYLNSESSILDIMCGSGSVAGATSMKWKTYASDAMKFCRILGKVQGSGFSLKRANELLTDLHNDVQVNIKYLKNIFKEELELEDILLHSEISEDLKLRYNKFCYTYSYPNGKFGEMYFAQTNKQNQWSLFSLAYSNLYLGLRQAIELDSYRYAIEQVLKEEEKSWALAALITTISAVGNNYGGHFAQPKYKDIEALNLNGLFALMEQRSISISNEFAIRLRSIAVESEKSKGAKIESLDGPWENALMSFSAKLIENTVNLVYLDAPYTRDEYSRYYHLLETLVDYKYYPLIGVGRVPDKKNSSRFSSEFFTKTSNKLKLQYVKIISKILDEGLICAWSYSDSATVAAMEIILEVSSITDCIITSLSTPYSYKAQGGQASKNINEYLIFFQPKL